MATARNGHNDMLTIAGRTFRSRLFLGTGKYRNSAEMLAAFEAAGWALAGASLLHLVGE